ncbi:MAG: hypothetical protein R6V74_03315 [Lutibacter sp.]
MKVKTKKFIPHKFFIDGVLYRDLETYRDLATWIIKESMKANNLTFRKNNKKEYIRLWLAYFESVEEEPVNPFMTIAETIFAEREICQKTQNHKMNSRISNTVRFRIMKQLEAF